MIPTHLKNKVEKITQDRLTSFKNGIHGRSWVNWFKLKHLELVLRVSQGLDQRAKALNFKNVARFYCNLEQLYLQHNYPPYCIWNIDETGCQASQNRLDEAFSKRAMRGVH